MNLLCKITKDGKIIAQNDFVLVNDVRIHGVYSIELEYPKIKLYDCNGFEMADAYFHDVTHLEIVGEDD